jgi:hypothetical protein
LIANLNIGDAIKGIGNIIDEFSTTEEERADAKAKLLDIENNLVSKIVEHESEMLRAKSDVIIAEAKSESKLANSWRPILMLSITAILVHKYILYPWLMWIMGPGIPQLDLPPELFTLLTFGVGGYVVGRSGEKITETIKASKSVNTITRSETIQDRKDQKVKAREMRRLVKLAEKNGWSEEFLERQMEIMFEI